MEKKFSELEMEKLNNNLLLGSERIKITNKQLGLLLAFELNKGFNIIKISNWAHSIFLNHLRDLTNIQADILQILFTMQDDSEFEYSEEELRELCDILVNENNDDPLSSFFDRIAK